MVILQERFIKLSPEELLHIVVQCPNRRIQITSEKLEEKCLASLTDLPANQQAGDRYAERRTRL